MENKLLYLQQTRHESPFVSCSHEWSIAQSFALYGNTPGYVLTISGDPASGFDFEELRNSYSLFGDTVSHLKEFGVPRRLGSPFVVECVDLVAPFGQPAVRVKP
ncbi:hypothetical protein Ate02nite_48190 [Paractinoplanes tereljensis]|uniref:Uncharacterized protein n=1 Tax=Paractinoplanes tereljensis TaxID=571912 RepID=A0A919NNG3_9ACTN|nr:hypothetical protein Ate02nite_48190 [Actinoplanes tereljensis]